MPGRVVAFSVVLTLAGVLTHSLAIYSRLFVLAIAALIFIAGTFRRSLGLHPEYGFLAVALICGSLLSVSEPKSYSSWDERTHYKKAEYYASLFFRTMHFRPNIVPSSSSLEEQHRIDATVDSSYALLKRIPAKRTFWYSDVAYLPSALMIAAGNGIRLPHHLVFTLGRWINLVLFSFVVFLAIRKLITGKMILAVVALFPTSIFLASNYNYDSWVTAFTMLGCAYLFSELQQPGKKLSLCDMCVILGAFVLGLGPKAIYFPLLFLPFLFKPEKFTSPRQHRYFTYAVVSALLFVISSFVLPFVFFGMWGDDKRGGDSVNSVEQIRFILTDPVAYAKILFHFMVRYVHPLNASGYMTIFGYFGEVKGFWLLLTTVFVVVVSDNETRDDHATPWRVRFSVIGVFIATVALIATALYVSFTPVRCAGIAGVQPRYLIPLVFPLLYVLGSSRLKIGLNRNVSHLLFFAVMASVLLQGIWDKITCHYY